MLSRVISSRRFSTKFTYQPAPWISQFGASVWHEFSPLALKYEAVNLGQGFPNFQPPSFTLEAAQQAVVSSTPNINQYARPNGHIRLVNILAEIYSPLVKQTINPLTQIQVTSGASGGLFCAISSVVRPGDEVIVMAPWFDIYEGPIAQAGAKMVQLSLKYRQPEKDTPPTSASLTFLSSSLTNLDFYLDTEELKNAVTSKTKAIILNSPHNPTGKVFSHQELEEIAIVVRQSPNIVVITDEVYEWITYGDNPFPRFCTLPGMWERTMNVSSAGKTFSVTGWKIGWVYGPQKLIEGVSLVSQFTWFSVSTPMQEAIAVSLENTKKSKYLEELKSDYTKKKNYLMESLKQAGLNPIEPEGTFFILSDIKNFVLKKGQGAEPTSTLTGLFLDSKDWNFCRWLTVNGGVTAIPCSAFYTGNDKPTDTIRFTFCKTSNDLALARERLIKALPLLEKTE